MRMRLGLALLGTLLAAGISAGPASAAVCTKGTTEWTNPDGGAWKSEANWSNGLPSKACDAKITLAGDYGVAVGSKTGAGGVARSLTVGGATGAQNLVDDNSTCGAPPCNFDPGLVVGGGGIRVNGNGAIKMYAGNIASGGALRLAGGVLYGVGTVTAKRGVINIGGLLQLGGNAVININGSYSQDARATMRVGVPPEGAADTPGGLAASGMISLDGKLRVEGSAPARQAAFPMLVAGKGLFGRFNGLSFADQEYAPLYSAKGLDLGTVPATPDEIHPVLSSVRFQPASFAKQALLSLKASEAAKVDLRFERYPVIKPVTVRVVPAKVGANTYQLDAKGLGLRPGKYRLSLRAIDPAGNSSDPVSLIFTVRKR